MLFAVAVACVRSWWLQFVAFAALISLLFFSDQRTNVAMDVVWPPNRWLLCCCCCVVGGKPVQVQANFNANLRSRLLFVSFLSFLFFFFLFFFFLSFVSFSAKRDSCHLCVEGERGEGFVCVCVSVSVSVCVSVSVSVCVSVSPPLLVCGARNSEPVSTRRNK